MRQCLYTIIDNIYNNEMSMGAKMALMAALMIGCCIVGYLLGSLNFGIIISKFKYHDDIRKHGSGNGGTTNMLRTYGKQAAIWTFVGDTLKCAAAVVIGGLLWFDGGYIAGLFCVIGHVFPVFHKFRGGKGVAVTATVMLFTSPVVFLAELIIFAGILLSTKYMSLASIMAALLYPVFLSSWNTAIGNSAAGVAGMTGMGPFAAILMAALVVIMHKDNISRLLNKTEPKTDLFAKKKNNKKDDKEDKDE